jgi:peptidoglycan/xylan/chitin deacetylase (PgdA/CDA1 family)
MTGTVVFSLDFELGWGHRDVRPEYVEHLREEADEEFTRIRELVDLFDEYEISATWAVVGKLTETGDDPLFHNPDLFEHLIDAGVEHDIGLHSYEHLSFTDLSEAEARKDVNQGRKALSDWGVSPISFIYPRGEIDHTQILVEQGLKCYRTKSSHSRFQSFLQEVVPPVVSYSQGEKVPYPVPATQYLAARRPDELIRLNMKRSITRAVRKEGFIHFWLHPHNIYTIPNLFNIIEDCLNTIRRCSDRGDLECVTMRGLLE